jgi:uncharacterized membrane protein
MKINKTWIIVAIVAIVLTIIVLNKLGIQITPLLVVLLKYAIPLAVIGYLIILAKCCLVKMQESKTSADLNALKESLDRIEKKVDKIEKILENVSE